MGGRVRDLIGAELAGDAFDVLAEVTTALARPFSELPRPSPSFSVTFSDLLRPSLAFSGLL